MDFDTKKKCIKLLLMWIVSIAVLGLAYFTVVFPLHQAVSQKKVEVAVIFKELTRVREYVSEENYRRLMDQRAFLARTLEGFVASGSKVRECTYTIADIAGNVGVSDFTTKQNTAKGSSEIQNCQLLKRALVDISCKGSYLRFLQLVNEYERARPLVLIDKFTFSATEGDDNDIEMSLLILVDNQSKDIKM